MTGSDLAAAGVTGGVDASGPSAEHDQQDTKGIGL
jgi:hypothetical protein